MAGAGEAWWLEERPCVWAGRGIECPSLFEGLFMTGAKGKENTCDANVNHAGHSGQMGKQFITLVLI